MVLFMSVSIEISRVANARFDLEHIVHTQLVNVLV